MGNHYACRTFIQENSRELFTGLGVVRAFIWLFSQLIFVFFVTVLGSTLITNAFAASGDEWFLDSNMVNLDSGNRYLGGLVATNPGKGPIYLKVSVNRIDLVNGARKISPDEGGALKAFPNEFVLRPGQSFPIRLLVDLSKQTTNSQSYYVNVADVSNLQADYTSKQGALGAGYLLAYEAMVSVQKESLNQLKPEHFSLTREANGQMALQNLSGFHIYLNRGDACPTAETLLVDCSSLAKFPRQTMLPGEKLLFPAFDFPVLGMLAYPKLNTRVKANLLYLKVPGGN